MVGKVDVLAVHSPVWCRLVTQAEEVVDSLGISAKLVEKEVPMDAASPAAESVA
jgi:hypothetical protein